MGYLKIPVSARSSSLYLSTNHVLHDFDDSAISGEARSAASAIKSKNTILKLLEIETNVKAS